MNDRRLAKKVLLIGWDAADWKMLNPMLDAGLMPTLNQFVNEGAIGNAATLYPTLSPILWNSIATGKTPHKHGILGFLEPQPDGGGVRTISSTSRKCKALWNIATQAGLRSHVVSWFASHPAEPINGVCISNCFNAPPASTNDWPVPNGSIYPPELADKLTPFRVHPCEIEAAHIEPFIPKAIAIDQSSEEEQRRLNGLRKNLAECASVHATATWLMENEPWDFMAVYYEAIDILGHFFMPFHPPKMDGVSEKNFAIYKDVMTGVYRFHDMMLQRLLQLAGPETVVILISDHGFYSDHLRPAFNSVGFDDPVAWHRPYGIIGMNGPGIVADERIYGASILDVAPTVLSLLGLPVADDMDGKVLVQAFQKPPEVQRIPSWETVPGEAGLHPADLRQDPVAAQEAIQQLVDLGYVQAPSANVKETTDMVVDNLHYNLGISLLNYSEASEAEKIFEGLFAKYPNERRYGYQLAQTYFKRDKFIEVRRILEKFLEKDGNSPGMELMFGSLLLAEGNSENALLHFRSVEAKAPNTPQLQIRLGNACLQSRKWAEATQAFQKALDTDGDSAMACYGMSIGLMRAQKLEQAAEFALRALGLQHFFPAAHFQLGAILAQLNQPARAALAFEHGLAMKPGVLVAHRYLARLYYRLGEFKKCHEQHEAISRLRAKVKNPSPPESEKI